MPDAAFEISYPCYFALTEQGTPERVQIDGAVCVCLFTDSDLIEAFRRHKYRTPSEQELLVYPFETAAKLRAFLRRTEQQFAEENCRHVAIDASPGLTPMYATFRELIADLEWAG